jgi:hypothetical protein
MIERFDAMPQVEAPGGRRLGLDTAAHLGEIKAGWLRGGWSAAGLWSEHDRPEQALRRAAAEFFRGSYAAVAGAAPE